MKNLEWSEITTDAFTWPQGLAYANVTRGDWRLPTLEELTACFDYELREAKFEGFNECRIWSSTVHPDIDIDFVWHFNFNNGSIDANHKSDRYFVRLVREEK